MSSKPRSIQGNTGKAGRPRIRFLLPLLPLLAACASAPQQSETVWVSVVEVYSPESLSQSYNERVRKRFQAAGVKGQDIEQGRLLRVACGLGTDYTWGSYAYVPTGMEVKKEDVLQLRIDDPGTNDRMGMNPVLGKVDFKWPGSLRAHRYIPDWKERNLFLNFERIPLERGQEGRYVVTHGAYLIKCRQPG